MLFVLVNFLGAEPLDIAKVKAESMSKILNLTTRQTDKLSVIFRSDLDDIRSISRDYPEEKTTMEEMKSIMRTKLDRIDAIKKLLSADQFNKYLSIEANTIKNKLTLFVRDEIGLDNLQVLVLDSISYYMMVYFNLPGKINLDSGKQVNSNSNISDYFFLLRTILKDNQKYELDVSRKEIQKFIRVNLIGVDDLYSDGGKTGGRGMKGRR